MMWYSTRDAANLLGLTQRRVQQYARAGILEGHRGPHSEYRLSFQDLALLRTAARLQAARVPARRIRRALDQLRRDLPRGQSLSELCIIAESEDVVVHEGGVAWNPVSGQYEMAFRPAVLGGRVAPLAGRAAPALTGVEPAESSGPVRELGARGWFEKGLGLETAEPAEARTAYERALELDPEFADAHVNLGRLLHVEGEAQGAEAHYRAALTAGPHPTAAYDLGVALEDLGRVSEALAAYERAIGWDPDLAEAHYNLARLLERRGDVQGALRHLGTCYRILRARSRDATPANDRG
jgi:tetratricopeptide (TPR) repeat protein